MSSASIPSEAIGLVTGVLVYSVICLSTSMLLYITLITLREYTNYITLLAAFVSISTAASVSQQIDYAINWREIKEREFEESMRRRDDPLQLANVYGNQAIFFWIQYYCYNVNALLLFFWAVNLGKKMWKGRAPQRQRRKTWPSVAAKISSVVLPGILIGIVQLDFVIERRVLQIILGNLCMELSFAFGSIVIVATLIKYLINRKTISYGSNYSYSRKGSVSVKPAHAMEDRWIIFRFTAAFVILSAFGVWLIIFQLLQSESKDELVDATEPDLSFDDLKEDALTFIPGVTASLGCFVLFGTTAPLRRRYASWFQSFTHVLQKIIPSWLQTCCRCGQRRRRKHVRELQPAAAAAPSQPIRDLNFDAERAYPNPDRIMSSPLSLSVSPLTLSQSRERIGGYGSTVELQKFAATPATLAEPDPLVLPSPRIITTTANFSVPMSSPSSPYSPSPLSSQQRTRVGNDRYYPTPPTRLPRHVPRSYDAIG